MSILVEGTLLSPAGHVIDAADIVLTSISTSLVVLGGTPLSVQTDPLGRYSFTLSNGNFAVSVSKEGNNWFSGMISVSDVTVPKSLNALLLNDAMMAEIPVDYWSYFQAQTGILFTNFDKINDAVASTTEAQSIVLSAKLETVAAKDIAVAAAEKAESIGDNEYTFKTIAAGIVGTVTGQYFRVPGGPDDLAAFYYYLNDNGSAVQVSQTVGVAAVERAIAAADKSLALGTELDARTKGIENKKKVYDEDGELIGAGFFDNTGRSPLNYTASGAVNLPGFKVQYLKDDPDKEWVGRGNKREYFGGSKLGGLIMGRVEIATIPGPPGVVFVDKNFIPYARSPGYKTDLDIPVIGGGGSTPPSPLTSMFRFYDYLGVRSEGQSLSLGAANPGDNPNPMSTVQKYGNKGFSKNNNSDTTDTDTLVPLVEKRYQPTEGTWPGAETPVTGATNKLVEMTQAETGLTFDHQPCAYIGSAPGTGGQPIINLIKGTAAYSRSLDHTRNSLRLAAAEGRTFAELAAMWRQGESDYRDETPRDVYLSTFLQYLSDYRADKKAITGQQFDLIFISYQLSTHRAYRRTNPSIALALRDAALLGKTDIAYPGYIGDYYESDHIHGMPETYFMFSQYEGRLIYKMRKDMLEGVTGKMHRLDVIDEIRQGIFTMLYFNVPTPPLVLDTEWVTKAENMGFYIRDKFSLDVIEIITSVDIAGLDRIRITTSRPLLDNEIVTYGRGKAGDPMTNGRQTGPRGNLRDSEGDLPGESYTDGAGVLRKLHNWCVIF